MVWQQKVNAQQDYSQEEGVEPARSGALRLGAAQASRDGAQSEQNKIRDQIQTEGSLRPRVVLEEFPVDYIQLLEKLAGHVVSAQHRRRMLHKKPRRLGVE